jgi:hypothetical protein
MSGEKTMSEANGKKSESRPTVSFSGAPCSLCEKTGETVLLSHKGFRAVVCCEHQLALLKKWKKQKEGSSVSAASK